MLISPQNHVNKGMRNPMAFRGELNLANVAAVAQEVGANFGNDFDTQRASKRAKTPAQQIEAMRLPGDRNFKVSYSVAPSTIGNVSNIEAVVSADGCIKSGHAYHSHKLPHGFGENMVEVTKRAVDAMAISPEYIGQRAYSVKQALGSRGTNIEGLWDVCCRSSLLPRDAHDFLTGLQNAVKQTKTASVSLSPGVGRREILVTKKQFSWTIKIPRFGGLRRTKGQILADRLLKLL